MKRSLLLLAVAAAVAMPTSATAQPNARAKAVTQFQIAKARFARDLDWHDLQSNLRQVIELDPSFAKPYFHLGLVAVKLEQFESRRGGATRRPRETSVWFLTTISPGSSFLACVACPRDSVGAFGSPRTPMSTSQIASLS